MEFDEYQDSAALTDQFRDETADDALMIPLLGIAGETGTLLSEFKKKIRDKESYEGFKDRAQEELGDVLWYLANLATHLDLSLSEIAARNLRKVQERWPMPDVAGTTPLLDSEYPESEQLPREMLIELADIDPQKIAQMKIVSTGQLLGDELTNNAYDDDGYRFHDVMHLAHVAVLGWSPVVRALLDIKRRSDPQVDEVEDGARAAILEELIIAFVYSNAKDRKYYEGIRFVDTEMLGTIKRLVAHLEVGRQRMIDWEQAILQGYAAFRHLMEKKRVVLRVNMNQRKLEIVE